MPALKWAPAEPSTRNPLGDIAFEIVACGTNRTKLWEIWRNTKNLKFGYLCCAIWCGIVTSIREMFTDTRTRLSTWAAKFKQKYDTTRLNTTQHVDMHIQSHTDTHTERPKHSRARANAHTDIRVISDRVRVPLSKVVQCHFLKTVIDSKQGRNGSWRYYFSH